MFKRVRAPFEVREKRQLAQRKRDLARHAVQGCYKLTPDGPCLYRFCPSHKETK